jgi:NADH dehydrogenase
VDCLVHLAGILIESATSTYQTANVDATFGVAEACKAAGVRHIVLVSVLGADSKSSNPYLRSKGESERLVGESGMAATIIRTPILMGPGTAGGRSLLRSASQGSVRLLGGGRYTTRPLDVDDLCAAILNACRSPRQGVTVHELAGPESTTYRDLVLSAAGLMNRKLSVHTMPIWLARAGASVAGWFKGGGMTPTVIDVITSNESVTKNADADLGVALTPMSKTLRKLVHGDGHA